MPTPKEVTISYDPKNKTIDFCFNGDWFYQIDMELVKTPIHVLEWIRQLSHKNWVDCRTFSNLSDMMIRIIEGKPVD